MVTNDSTLPLPPHRLFLDKLGFQFPAFFLDGDRFKDYAKGDLTILKWGLTARVLLHDERLREACFPAMALLQAAVELAHAGVFNWYVKDSILNVWDALPTGRLDPYTIFTLIQSWFVLDELELALDQPGIEFFATFDPKAFVQVKRWTFYSRKDFQRKRRGDLSDRAGESKGVQKSFFTVYRKDLQQDLPYPVTRLEFRFSGRYRRYLANDLLYMDPETILLTLSPAIRRISTFLGIQQGMAFNPLTLLFPGSPLARLLDTIQWTT